MINNNVGIGFVGIDTNRIIATNPPMPYTATEDCFIYIYGGSSANYLIMYVNGKLLLSHGAQTTTILPIKKGDVLTRNNGTITNMVVYGLKY